MKKLISLLLAVLMVFGLVACGGNTEETKATEAPATEAPTTEATEEVTEAPTETVDAAAEKVAAFVAQYGQSIVDGIATGAADQAEATVYAEGRNIVIELRFLAFENVDEASKAAMQATYDAQDNVYEQLRTTLQTQIPELENLIFNVCDKNGDLLATVVTDGEITTTAPTSSSEDPIQAYVDVYGQSLIEGIESSFTSAGMTCTSTVEAIDGGIVINININELENVDAAAKAELQATYDASFSEMQPIWDTVKLGLPELQYLTYNICDKNGDLLATIKLPA